MGAPWLEIKKASEMFERQITCLGTFQTLRLLLYAGEGFGWLVRLAPSLVAG